MSDSCDNCFRDCFSGFDFRVFSLAQQAINLGFCPRLRIVHTSQEIRCQIYVPAANCSLIIACLGVVIMFKESSALAGAYGIAVTGTMTITSHLVLYLNCPKVEVVAMESGSSGCRFPYF